jgi:serine/threonine protein kinase
MEYVHGRDLRSIFDDMRNHKRTMPVAQVCYVVMQVCEGLDYAHNKRDSQGRSLNLVHRDVSPQNVLIGYEGEVKLIDFGIAKAAGKASKTQAGILKGKFGYMSPEQVRGLPIDRRSDIFALGIILYEMLTGERLFIGESDFSTLEKVRNVDVQPPSSFNAQIPEQLERIVLKALAKDVEDRYQNAIDLHDDLQAFLYSVGQFTSRKDLSAWMKRTYAMGQRQEDEMPDVDDVDDLEVDTAANSAPPGLQKTSSSDRGGLDWDDEEMETEIFDRDPAALQPNEFEANDKTMAGAPSESLMKQLTTGPGSKPAPRPPLASARPSAPASPARPSAAMPGANARPPASGPVQLSRSAGAAPVPPKLRQTVLGVGQVSGGPGMAPPPALVPPSPNLGLTSPASQPRLNLELPRPGYPSPTPPGPGAANPAFRQTLLGVPAGQIPGAPGAPGSGVPAPNLHVPSPAFQSPQLVNQGLEAPLSGYPVAPARYLKPPSRLRYYVLFLAFMIAGGGGAYVYLSRPGKLQVNVKPLDARVLVDGSPLRDGPPFIVEKRPGVYHLALNRDGYLPREQKIEIRAGQFERLDVDLDPSPETGFELTSQPPGGLVWLDGAPFMVDEQGKQATTNFKALRVVPGRHVIEIKGNPKYKDWRQEVFQEAGQILRINADLQPAGASGASAPIPTPIPVVGPKGTPAVQPVAVPMPPIPSEARRPAGRKPFKAPAAPAVPHDGVSKPAFPKPSRPAAGDEDIFENATKASASPAAGGGCVATLTSKPWAQVAIDGKPTGKSTPLTDYPMPCGKHRITFTNPDLMIERNESITLTPGQKFKKNFPLVDTSL